MATAYLTALSNLSQSHDKSISDYMHRAQLLVLKAHPDLGHVPRERILVTSFLFGLYDRQLAASLAVVKINIAADRERLAAEGEVVRQDQRFRRSNNHFLGKEPFVGNFDNSPDADLKPLDEEEDELTAALDNFGANRRLESQSGKLFERKRRHAAHNATTAGNTGISSSSALEPHTPTTDDLHRVLCWSACCATAIT